MVLLCSGMLAYADGIIQIGDRSYVGVDKALVTKAHDGDILSQVELATMLLDGNKLKRDVKQAIKWYEKAAAKNNGYAQFMLSIIYKKEQLQNYDVKKSTDFFEKGIKGRDVAYNLYKVAQYLSSKDSYLYNMEESLYWFEQAADRGYVAAQNSLADIYLYHQEITSDPLVALNYYGKAAAHGSSYAKYAIGVMYYDGAGIDQNKKEAFKWFVKAATQGFAPAQYRVAKMYLEHDGAPYDLVEAYAWLNAAHNHMVLTSSEDLLPKLAARLNPAELKDAVNLAGEYQSKFEGRA